MLPNYIREARRAAIETRFLAKLSVAAPCVEITGKFRGMKEDIKARCTKCKATFMRKPKAMLTKRIACINCSKMHEREAIKTTVNTAGLQALLACIKSRRISLLEGTFTSRSALASFKCLTCGHEWEQYPKALMACKHGCRVCSNRKLASTDLQRRLPEYLDRLAARGFKIDKAPTSIHELRKLTCLKCRYTWLSTLKSVKPTHLSKAGCPKCAQKNRADGCRGGSYEYKLGRRRVTVAGFEPQALDWLLSNTTVKPQDIRVQYDSDTPTIKYRCAGIIRTYYPDFYIPSRNILVEVKSTATLDLRGIPIYEGHYAKTQAKARACVKAGFRYRLLLMTSDGKRIRLPKDWYTMSKRRLLSYINDNNVIYR